MLSYVFLTVLDLAARFISVTLHVDNSLKMAAKLGDCQKLGNFTELYSFCKGRAAKLFSVVIFSLSTDKGKSEALLVFLGDFSVA